AEFGFDGIVMTDWIVAQMFGRGNKYSRPTAPGIAAAGNDLTMPGSAGDYKALLQGLQNGLVTKKQLQINATRVVRKARELAGE
ncbi:MAG: beta-glucosidase-related glycosidase, partial [Lachnospiraceae bacterium]|nr:beta-glucosidase-related glycosidase [Lachnospiraceae bacterium]